MWSANQPCEATTRVTMSIEDGGVIIMGGGGHARVLFELLRASGARVLGFVAPAAEGSRLDQLPWLGPDSVLFRVDPDVEVVNGVGSAGHTSRRVAAYERAESAGLRFRTLIHAHAIVEPTATLGIGSQILAGAFVGVSSRVGEDAIINSGALIEHDTVVGPHSHIASGAVLAGDVHIGESTHIGLGARVRQGVRIGSQCVIGAGAVVIDDVPTGTTWVGVPARPVSTERRS